MGLTPEQQANLPYGTTPATSTDVATEVRHLATLIATILAGGGDFTDLKREPGTSVVVQQTRLALALDSWQAQNNVDLATIVFENLPAANPAQDKVQPEPYDHYPEPTPLDPGYDISGDDTPSLWPLIRRAARWLQHPPRAANPTSPTEDA